MKLIVGLGNPGEKYKNTRHNVGFLVLDTLESQISNQFSDSSFQLRKKFSAEVFKLDNILLAKPTTFMNSSGVTVKKLVNQYKINMSDLWVIHDDLDLRLGEYKIQFGVGPKLHNGIASIEEKLGKKDFWRVRVGVDNRDKDNKIPGEEYVLRNFSEEERKTIDKISYKIVVELIAKLNEDLVPLVKV